MDLRRLCLLFLACWLLFACQAQKGEDPSQPQPSSVSPPASSQQEELPSSSQTQEQETELASFGIIDGQSYSNDVLGFSYRFPEGWTLFDGEQALEIQLEKAKAAYGDTQELERSIELGSLVYLLYAQAPALQAENNSTVSSPQEEAEDIASVAPANILVQAAPAVALRDLTPAAYLEALAEQTQETYEDLGERMEYDSVEIATVGDWQVALLQGVVTLDSISPEGAQVETTIYQGYSVFLAEDRLVISLLLAQDESHLAEGMEILRGLSTLEAS